MKSSLLNIVFMFFSMAVSAFAGGVLEKFESLVLRKLDTESVRKVSVATRVFDENNYFKVQGMIFLNGHQQKTFAASLTNLEWHDSMSVVSRVETEFVVILETNDGDVYGLHAANGIESDCFYLVQISLADEAHVSATFFRQIVKNVDGQLKPFNRVLKIPGWRATEDGRKLLSLVESAQKK